MVQLERHEYRPVEDGSPDRLSAPACSCGWRGPGVNRDRGSSDPAFDEWLQHHLTPYLDAGGLRLLVAWDGVNKLVDAFARPESVYWRAQNRDLVALAWGWWANTYRTADAISALFSIGKAREAVPLVRVVFEHTLYLEALVRHGSPAVDAALREQARQLKNFVETAKGGPGYAGISQVQVDPIPNPVPDAAWTQQIVEICKRLGATSTVYTLYRLLSGFTHPTVGAAQEFLQSPEDFDPGLSKDAPSDLDSDAIFWTAVMLVWAGRAFNNLLDKPLMRDELDLVAREIGVVPIDQIASSTEFGILDVERSRINEVLFGHTSA